MHGQNHIKSDWVFVALGTQDAMRMSQSVVCGLSGCTVFFPHYFIKGTILEKKIIEHKPVFWLSPKPLPETFLILGRIKRHLTKNIYWFSCKVPIILLWFQRKLNYLDRFSGNNEISNLIENHPVGADLFHADRRTEMTTLLDAFFAIFRKHLKRVIFNAFWFYLYFV